MKGSVGRSMLGMGFMAAVASAMGFGRKKMGQVNKEVADSALGDFGMPGGYSFPQPMWGGKSQRKRKQNRLKFKSKARLKRRKK